MAVPPAEGASRWRSISSSVASESLKPSRAEELDAVVLVGVVRGAEHGREVELVAAQQQRGGGRRQDAAEQDLAAGGGDARGQGRLEHLARLARVADDEHARVLGAALAGDRRRGAAEAEREVGGELLAGDAADAVGPEQLAPGCVGRRGALGRAAHPALRRQHDG